MLLVGPIQLPVAIRHMVSKVEHRILMVCWTWWGKVFITHHCYRLRRLHAPLAHGAFLWLLLLTGCKNDPPTDPPNAEGAPATTNQPPSNTHAPELPLDKG